MRYLLFILFNSILFISPSSLATDTIDSITDTDGDISMFIEREYYHRGLSRSNDKAGYGFRFSYQTESFFKVGTEIKFVDFANEPANKTGANYQLRTFIGLDFSFKYFRLDIGGQFYNYPGVSTSLRDMYDYDEQYVLMRFGSDNYNATISSQVSEEYFLHAGEVEYNKLTLNFNLINGVDLYILAAEQNYQTAQNLTSELQRDYSYYALGLILGVEEFNFVVDYGRVILSDRLCPQLNGCSEKFNFSVNISLE